MTALIITGASRGLGAALARMYLESGACVAGWARHPGTDWDRWSRDFRGRFFPWCSDLAGLEHLAGGMTALVQSLGTHKPSHWILINNAALIEPVKPLEKCTGTEIAHHLGVNLGAPAALAAAFLRTTPESTQRQVINISSGAARKAYPGWSLYGAGKAGLDHLTRCAALEQEGKPNPVRFISFSPGILDTGMQVTIRSLEPEDFPPVQRFRDFRDEGKLQPAETVAEVIFNLVLDTSVPNGSCIDITQR